MKIKAIYLFLILISKLSFCQNTTVKDFNSDGLIDSLLIERDLGSQYVYIDIKYIDGTKIKDNVSIEHDFSMFWNITCLKDNLKNTEVINEITTYLNTIFLNLNEIDPSILWLIQAYNSKKSDNEYPNFDIQLNFKPKWLLEKPRIPINYSLLVNNENGKSIFNTFNQEFKCSNLLISYWGQNHGELKLIDDNKNIKIYVSNHGVVLNVGGKYSWVFISDGLITEGVTKLRRESISNVSLKNDFIIVTQSSKFVFLINYLEGICLRVDPDLYNNKEITKIVACNKHFVLHTLNGNKIKLRYP